LSSRVVLPILAGLVLVPAIVYMATFTQYFVKGHTLADWWELHRQMYIFGLNLRAEHTYASIAPSWIVNYRPVWYYFSSGDDYRGVVAIGNPFLWWAAALALLAAPLVALRRATWMLVPAALVAVLYLPWFATSRTSFLYYMTPVAPFMAILVAAALADYAGRVHLRLSHWLVAAGVAAATALLWRPVGRLAEWLLWQLPRQAHPLLGWVAVAAVAFVALLGLFYLASGRMRRTRPMTAMVASGLMVGIVAAFIPVLLAIPISQEHFYRITWFSSWI
jgi:dolichyl-phosphate-mannose--protein O-mannosyl transferase